MNRKIKIRFFAVFLGLIIALPLMGMPDVEAASVSCKDIKDPTNKNICEASIEYCGKEDTAAKRACRKGYREAAKDGGKAKHEVCTGANKADCERGYDLGEAKLVQPFGPPSGYRDVCGKGDNAIKTKVNFGCQGGLYTGPGGAIGDITFAIIRFISYGVGAVVVMSIIVSGIQYTTSEGNPETTQAAKNRIQRSIIALVFYIFAFSLIQFLVPGGLFT